MRVAQLLCAGRFAGAESVACSLASALRPHVERSLLYLVIETRAERAARDELVARVQALDVRTRLFETDKRFSWALLRQLRAAFRADGLDVAHSHSYKTAFMAPLIRQRDPASVGAIAFTLHGIDLAPSVGWAFLGAINTIGALGSDVLIACSRPIERHYRRFPFLGRKTRCLLNGLRPGFIPEESALHVGRSAMRQQLAMRHGLDPSAVWIAVVGRLVSVKNHDLLLRAVSARAKAGAGALGAQLLVAGDGPLRESLHARARTLGIEADVRFAGQVSDIEKMYAAVDILALSSTSEGTPMVVLEAMAYGVPVVATRVGGIADQVEEGATALLVPSEDEAALASALARLVRDPALRDRMGRAGRQRAISKFGPDDWAGRHVKLYEELIGR